MMDMWLTERYENKVGSTYRIKSTLYHHQSPFQVIDIVDTEAYGRMLLLDGLVMTTEKDEFIYHEMITHIPLLAHPNPESVLIIGGGDGGTVREVLRHPSVQRVVLCEIDGDVIEACRKYLPTIASKLDDSRLDIQVKDGVQYINEHPNSFDAILIDSTDPIGPGEGLFTDDFYQSVYAALTEQGVMAAQTGSPVLNPSVFKATYERLQKSFPVAQPYLATIPTYPGALWSWAFCSKGLKPLESLAQKAPLMEQLAQDSRFYNPDIHDAVFALPNMVKHALKTPLNV